VLVISGRDDKLAADNVEAIKDLPGVYNRVLPGKTHGFGFLAGETEVMAGWLTEHMTHRAPVPAKTKAAQPAQTS
jgi:hypothetical protein